MFVAYICPHKHSKNLVVNYEGLTRINDEADSSNRQTLDKSNALSFVTFRMILSRDANEILLGLSQSLIVQKLLTSSLKK